jgi:NAD(P)-dependent dehydrogenase (short-subunit alcohol dehydrogenase family)
MLQNKTCLITGATNGIGRQTALELAKLGANVVIIGRSAQKVDETVASITAETGNKTLAGMVADLSLLAEVKKLAAEVKARYSKLDVLINNAGGIFTTRTLTSEGHELSFALNHLSYFALTTGLTDLIRASQTRVISVSSDAHFTAKLDFADLELSKNYNAFLSYSRSKLMNVMFSYALERRLQGSGATTYVLHPGPVRTNFGRNNKGVPGMAIGLMMRIMGTSVEKGAETPTYLASAPEVTSQSGKYWHNKKFKQSNQYSYNTEDQEQLWALSEVIVAKS